MEPALKEPNNNQLNAALPHLIESTLINFFVQTITVEGRYLSTYAPPLPFTWSVYDPMQSANSIVLARVLCLPMDSKMPSDRLLFLFAYAILPLLSSAINH